MASHEPEAANTNSENSGGRDSFEDEDVHELQDHEFTLEQDDTIELQSSLPPSAPPLPSTPPQPPLPRWAAASRALLDSWQKLLDINAQATTEITTQTPDAGARQPTPLPASRQQLAQLGKQLHAREVYCREIERGLAAASGKVRGQAFRIAELEAELALVRSSVNGKRVAQPQPLTAPSLEITVERDDLCRIRGIGRVLSERLAGLGVTSYATIANWSAAEVGEIARQLGVNKERLTRDSWVKQARALTKPARAARPNKSKRSATRRK